MSKEGRLKNHLSLLVGAAAIFNSKWILFANPVGGSTNDGSSYILQWGEWRDWGNGKGKPRVTIVMSYLTVNTQCGMKIIVTWVR